MRAACITALSIVVRIAIVNVLGDLVPRIGGDAMARPMLSGFVHVQTRACLTGCRAKYHGSRFDIPDADHVISRWKI